MPSSENMCTQVNIQWRCGHFSYFKIEQCGLLFKGCLGPGPIHDTLYTEGICTDCKYREDNAKMAESLAPQAKEKREQANLAMKAVEEARRAGGSEADVEKLETEAKKLDKAAKRLEDIVAGKWPGPP